MPSETPSPDCPCHVPKFPISQSKALSTVLISCDIKSLTWYGCDSMLTWPNLDTTVNRYRTVLVRLDGIWDSFGLARIPTMAPPNSPDVSPKCTKKVWLGLSTILEEEKYTMHQFLSRFNCRHILYQLESKPELYNRKKLFCHFIYLIF